MTQQVRRKIHFFEIIEENCRFDDVLRELNALSEDQMYSEIGNDKKIYIQKYRRQTGYSQCILSYLKMNDLPNRGTIGEREPEPLGLGDNQGLVDATHLCYFPGSKILVIEYNHTGPRASSLEGYIKEKLMVLKGADTNESVQIKPILSQEFLEKLDKIGEIKTFSMQVPISRAGDLSAIDVSLPDAIRHLSNLGDTDEVEVVFRKKPRSRNPIFREAQFFVSSLREMFQSTPPSETFNKAVVKAMNNQSGDIEEFDLLQDKTESEIKTVKLGNSRSVDTESFLIRKCP